VRKDENMSKDIVIPDPFACAVCGETCSHGMIGLWVRELNMHHKYIEPPQKLILLRMKARREEKLRQAKIVARKAEK
jgi:hypothetical protein